MIDEEKRRAKYRRYHQRHREDLRPKWREAQKKRADEAKRQKAEYAKHHKLERQVEDFSRVRTVLGSECVYCHSTENLERHHPDYTKPLEVLTVCRACHALLHRSDPTLRVVAVT